MTVKRTTQVVAESVSNVVPTSRASQVVAEVVSANALKMLASQLIVEMVSENVPDDVGSMQPVMLIIAT